MIPLRSLTPGGATPARAMHGILLVVLCCALPQLAANELSSEELAAIVVLLGSSPVDSDDDGLTDDEEEALGTDPANPDTDGDSLSDGEEVNQYGTSPKRFDSDGDGIDDGTEIADGSDPLSDPIPIGNSAGFLDLVPYTEDMVSDDSNGDRVIRTELAVMFLPDATSHDLADFLETFEATKIAKSAGSRSILIRVPDPGSIDALNALIAQMDALPYIEFVLKSIMPTPKLIPDNIAEPVPGNQQLAELRIIDNQLSVGAAAAWNARSAINNIPDVVLTDFFGGGLANLVYVDATINGEIATVGPDSHGYHVAGILAGSFGGSGTTEGKITGMMPDRINLKIFDLQDRFTSNQMDYLLLDHVYTSSGTVIVSSSLGYDCELRDYTDVYCRDPGKAEKRALWWIELIRSRQVENHFLHFVAAGNRDEITKGDLASSYDYSDAETGYYVTAAALLTGLRDANNDPVAPLSNVLVIENAVDWVDEHPASVACLSENSFIGGHLSAIGTGVTSLSYDSTIRISGTSMATPQAAGLAAYLLAIDSTLDVQSIKNILLSTAETVPSRSDPACSDAFAAPVINAYSAVLALDSESAVASGNTNGARVRHAILDIAHSDGTTEGGDGRFDEGDLIYFLDKIDQGNDEFEQGIGVASYGRADLNGDGYVGGRDNKKRFNLDADFPPTYESVPVDVEGRGGSLDESSLNDEQVLCYYAYSDLYTGDTNQRKSLLEGRCLGGDIAVYYTNRLRLKFPASGFMCPERQSEFEILDDTIETAPAIDVARPWNDYWQAGDAHDYLARSLDESQTITSGFDGQSCPQIGLLTATAEVNSKLALESVAGQEQVERLNVDIANYASSDCLLESVEGEPDQLHCSDAEAESKFHAEFEIEVPAAKDVMLKVNLECSGYVAGDSSVAPNVITTAVRFPNGDRSQPMGAGSFTTLHFCDGSHPTLDISELVELEEPGNPGDVDLVIFKVVGAVFAVGNQSKQNLEIQEPTIGSVRHDVSMKGTVSVEPVTTPP